MKRRNIHYVDTIAVLKAQIGTGIDDGSIIGYSSTPAFNRVCSFQETPDSINETDETSKAFGLESYRERARAIVYEGFTEAELSTLDNVQVVYTRQGETLTKIFHVRKKSVRNNHQLLILEVR